MSEREPTREDIVITGSAFEETPHVYLFGKPVPLRTVEPEPERELTREDIERYALLKGGDPIVRILDAVWCSASDLLGSEDFRDEDGEIPEDVYVRVKARAIRDAVEKLGRQA